MVVLLWLRFLCCFLMAAFTSWSPIIMYLSVKLFDVGKIIIAHFEIKEIVVNLSDN